MRGGRRRIGLALMISAPLALAPEPVFAQRSDPVGMLDIDLATSFVGFAPGVPDFDVGWIDHSGLLVSVRSRPPQRTWELRMRADVSSMGGYGKPVSDILWRTAASGAWAPLSGMDQLIAQGQGDADVVIHFRVRLDWGTDVPDLYDAGITFTLDRP